MKMNKLLLCVLLTLCLMLSLCACASEDAQSAETTAATEEPTTEAPTTEEPTTEEPTTEEPTTEEPTTEEPVSQNSELAAEIIGAWVLEQDLSELMVSTLSQSMGMDLSDKADELKLAINVTFDFAEDGTVKADFDEEALSASFDTFLTNFSGVCTEITYETVAQQGVSKEDADANFMQQYGCSIAEYYDEILHTSLDIDSILGALPTVEGNYLLEGDQLILSESGSFDGEALTVSIDGDEMTLDGEPGEGLAELFSAYNMELPVTLTRK